MTGLIVVSNRLPSLRDGKPNGGLAVALNAALKNAGGLWVGWSGAITEAADPRLTYTDLDGFTLGALGLTQSEFHGYYECHANRGLWPLFHGRLDLASFDHDDYGLYRTVNRRFAQAVNGAVGDDVVWVHDYHLIPLGAEMRRLGATVPIGFFLHIPFPPLEILTALPWYREVIEDLCAYDVVGFQTDECARNFTEACIKLGLRHADQTPFAPASRPSIAAYPIGIDTRAFAALAASPEVGRWCRRFERCMGDRNWAVGVERLDYTKGLPERFRAFEHLLVQSPELQGRLSLIQIASPSRETIAEYRDLQARLEAISGCINARLGTFNWTPIQYLNRTFDHTHIAALYRVSQLGVVTPLRDGMNLVAKEYVAAQDPQDPGVLVLSRFAGAAAELSDAVLVNPYDTEGMARALRTALMMPAEERQARWRSMMRHLEHNDVHRWRQRFLADLMAVRKQTPVTAAVA